MGARAVIVGVLVTAAAGGAGLVITAGGGVTCDSTLTSGQSISSAVTSVAAGGTVCLGAGSYTFNATISKSSMTKVTLDTANGATQANVTVNPIDLNSSNNLWFDGMTAGTSESGTSGTNIKYTNIRFTGRLCIGSTRTAANILVDGNLFDNLPPGACGGEEGGLTVKGSSAGSNGVTISNNEFDGSTGDAIALRGDANGTVIGPGNWIHDVAAVGGSGIHADAIQPYGAQNLTVTGNWIGPNNDGGYSDFDCNGSAGLVFTDNVVQRNGSAQNPVSISRNSEGGTITVSGNTLGDSTPIQIYSGNTPGAGNLCTGAGPTSVTVRDNVFNGGCSTSATSSTYDHNVSTDATCRGTGGYNGSATFTAGTTPTTVAGYLLTGGSLGHLGASDGADVGAPIASMTGAW